MDDAKFNDQPDKSKVNMSLQQKEFVITVLKMHFLKVWMPQTESINSWRLHL